MATEEPQWVIDTSVFTHLCRAGHAELLAQLAPGGVLLVPTEVNDEIERGRDRYLDILRVADTPWAQITVLTEAEYLTMLQIKAQLGGDADQHLGECAVIACALHRGLTALLDERAAVAQADRLNVPTRDTLWIVVEAYKQVLGRDRSATAQVVDDLIRTGMRLPVRSGESLLAWAYEAGLLP